LEGTYNNHLVQLPDRFRADQKLQHVVKGIVQNYAVIADNVL